MKATTESTANEVERAIPEVLETVRQSSGQMYASDVIAQVHQATGIRDEAVRHAIWRLISDKTVELTDERELALPTAHYSEA